MSSVVVETNVRPEGSTGGMMKNIRGGGRGSVGVRRIRHYFLATKHENAESNSVKRSSWLIPAIVVANTVVFVVTMYVNNCPKYNYDGLFGGNCVPLFLGRFSFQPLKENPFLGPSSLTLMKMGADKRINVVYNNQAWRLVTSFWLHSSLVHLAGNMLTLLCFAIRFERQFGFVRIGMIYFMSGVSSSILSSLFLHDYSLSIGSSGAIFGLIGAMLSELITNWNLYSNRVAALVILVITIISGFGAAFIPAVHVDNFGHMGVFLSGVLLGFIFLARPQLGWIQRNNLPSTDSHTLRNLSKYRPGQYSLCLVSLVLLIVGVTIGLMMLLKGEDGNDLCHWCHYLNCVPVKKGWCQHT